MRNVTFPTDDQRMLTGHLHLPENFEANGSHPAIVVAHPGGGVKEQTAGLYARRLAEQGYVTLAADASYQGESGGAPHYLEDPYARVEDVRAAVDHLQSLDFVDAERIGALGICAGGGYTVNATMTDRRIKAVATVVAMNIGTGLRRDYYGDKPDSAAGAVLDGAAKQRTAEAQGAEPAMIPYVPEIDENTNHDMREAYDYYLTPRAQHPNSENQFLFTRSFSKIAAFDAFHLVEDLLAQPVLVVAGSEAGTLWHSTELFSRARGPKKLVVVDGGRHIDFYDVPRYVDRAVAEAVLFFGENLAR